MSILKKRKRECNNDLIVEIIENGTELSKQLKIEKMLLFRECDRDKIGNTMLIELETIYKNTDIILQTVKRITCSTPYFFPKKYRKERIECFQKGIQPELKKLSNSLNTIRQTSNNIIFNAEKLSRYVIIQNSKVREKLENIHYTKNQRPPQFCEYSPEADELINYFLNNYEQIIKSANNV